MTKLEFNTIYPLLKREMNYITHFNIINYKEELGLDAEQVFLSLKPQIEEWIRKLNNKEISCAELHSLIQSKKGDLKFNSLLNIGISENEISFIKSSILGLISNTLIDSYLKSLFVNQKPLNNNSPGKKNGSNFFG
jgi:hypothetical protein